MNVFYSATFPGGGNRPTLKLAYYKRGIVIWGWANPGMCLVQLLGLMKTTLCILVDGLKPPNHVLHFGVEQTQLCRSLLHVY